MMEPRDRSLISEQEKSLHFYKRISAARHAETMRIADLIDVAMCQAETEETQKVLLDLAVRILKP